MNLSYCMDRSSRVSLSCVSPYMAHCWKSHNKAAVLLSLPWLCLHCYRFNNWLVLPVLLKFTEQLILPVLLRFTERLVLAVLLRFTERLMLPVLLRFTERLMLPVLLRFTERLMLLVLLRFIERLMLSVLLVLLLSHRNVHLKALPLWLKIFRNIGKIWPFLWYTYLWALRQNFDSWWSTLYWAVGANLVYFSSSVSIRHHCRRTDDTKGYHDVP